MTRINSLRQNTNLALLIIYLRYLIGGAYAFSGMGKALGERFIRARSGQIPQRV